MLEDDICQLSKQREAIVPKILKQESKPKPNLHINLNLDILRKYQQKKVLDRLSIPSINKENSHLLVNTQRDSRKMLTGRWEISGEAIPKIEALNKLLFKKKTSQQKVLTEKNMKFKKKCSLLSHRTREKSASALTSRQNNKKRPALTERNLSQQSKTSRRSMSKSKIIAELKKRAKNLVVNAALRRKPKKSPYFNLHPKRKKTKSLNGKVSKRNSKTSSKSRISMIQCPLEKKPNNFIQSTFENPLCSMRNGVKFSRDKISITSIQAVKDLLREKQCMIASTKFTRLLKKSQNEISLREKTLSFLKANKLSLSRKSINSKEYKEKGSKKKLRKCRDEIFGTKPNLTKNELFGVFKEWNESTCSGNKGRSSCRIR